MSPHPPPTHPKALSAGTSPSSRRAPLIVTLPGRLAPNPYHYGPPPQLLASPMGSLLAALTGALYGGLTQLLFKTCATAAVQFVQTGGFPWPSVASMVQQLVCAVSCAVGQVVFLNVAIASSPVAYAVPAYQSALLLITLSLAGWLLEEFAHMDPLHYVLFSLGCGLVLLGIVFNAAALKAADKGEEGRAKEDEEAVDLPLLPAAAADAEPSSGSSWMPKSLRSSSRRP